MMWRSLRSLTAVCLLTALPSLCSAVPPPIPIEKLVAEAQWVVIGELGPLARVPGAEQTDVRHGQIRVREVLKSPAGATPPPTLTLTTLDPASKRIGPVMYRAGRKGIWILVQRESGIYEAPNLNSLQPLDHRPQVDKAIHPELELLTVSNRDNADFRTLGEALAKAHPGATILVRPGVYHEGIVLKKPVNIIGDGPRANIVLQASARDCVYSEAATGQIKGLTLRCRAGAKQKFYAVDIAAGALVLEDCDLSSNSLACLGIHGKATDPIVRGCWIHDGADAGVFCYDHCDGTLVDCEIFGNTEAGVVIREASNPRIRGCRIHHGKQQGVLIDDDGCGTIEDCDIYHNAGKQVQIRDGWRAGLRDCRIEPKPLAFDTVSANVGDTDVDPSLTELVISFAQPMDTHGWHLAKVKPEGEFPTLTGSDPAGFRDPRTFVVHVQLEPGTQYTIGLNDDAHLDFQSAEGVPLEPTTLSFATRSAEAVVDQARPPKETPAGPAMPALDFLTFMRHRTRANFMAVRSGVRADPTYKPYSKDLDQVAELLSAKKYAEANAKLIASMPNLMLSPRAHLYAAMAHRAMGHEEQSQFEARCAQACVQGIRLTGDGSQAKPYLVLRVDDEYDVLQLELKKKKRRQALVRDQGRSLDVITCTDGTTVWFDVSVVLSHRDE